MAKLVEKGQYKTACLLHVQYFSNNTCKSEVLEKLYNGIQQVVENSNNNDNSDIVLLGFELLMLYIEDPLLNKYDSSYIFRKHLLRTNHFNAILRALTITKLYSQIFELFEAMSAGWDLDDDNKYINDIWRFRPSTFTIAELVRSGRYIDNKNSHFIKRVIEWSAKCQVFLPEGVISDAVSLIYDSGDIIIAQDIYNVVYKSNSITHWHSDSNINNMILDLKDFSRGMAHCAVARALQEVGHGRKEPISECDTITIITGKRGNEADQGKVSEAVQRILVEDFYPPISSSTGNTDYYYYHYYNYSCTYHYYY